MMLNDLPQITSNSKKCLALNLAVILQSLFSVSATECV
jgi:hypothetical protein